MTAYMWYGETANEETRNCEFESNSLVNVEGVCFLAHCIISQCSVFRILSRSRFSSSLLLEGPSVTTSACCGPGGEGAGGAASGLPVEGCHEALRVTAGFLILLHRALTSSTAA